MAERDPAAVREMFDRIARRYDLANTVLSLGQDAWWRRRAAAATALRPGGRALDVACGSGALSRAVARRAGSAGRVVGLDFSPRMLAVARRSHPEIPLVRGDALNLPAADGAFDAATIAFGLRNLADPRRGLEEMARVVRPGGRTVVLEFVKPPRGPWGALYRLYLKRVLPAVGGRISGDAAAYGYLSHTVDSYRTPAELVGMAAAAGWRDPRIRLLGLGTVGLLSATR